MEKDINVKKAYDKPALSHEQMIELLKSRGLSCGNEERVKRHLQHTGYYRLSGYFKSFQKPNDNFFPGITFDHVRDSYVFDRKLRLYTLDAIEKIEVSLKANMNDILSLQKGCFWYLEKTNFDLAPRKQSSIRQPIDTYNELIKKINQVNAPTSGRDIVKYYKSKYTTNDLPSWILFQELTLGEISNIYNILPQSSRQKIADVYGMYERDFKSRILTLMNVRNICAHHGRLWNRRYVFKVRAIDKTLGAKFKKYKNWSGSLEVTPNYYNLVLMLTYMLRRINRKFNRLNDLRKLLKSHKGKYNKRMGLGPKWYKHI